jgi:RNA polymerase sigma-70 factor, ECF subfamily
MTIYPMLKEADKLDILHVKRIKAGKTDSFDQMYRKYFPRLFAFSMHLTRSQTDADEIVQETFIKVWETRERLNSDLPFAAYLIKIARNLIYNKTTKRLREADLAFNYSQIQSNTSEVTSEEVNYNSLNSLLSEVVNQLPFMQKKVFTMSRLHGMSNQEIASRLQLSQSTVENHINLAIRKLKNLLLKHEVYLVLFLFI